MILTVMFSITVITLLVVFKLILVVSRLTEENTHANEQRRKWEVEYWNLRQSEAINRDFDIHLSWLPRGERDCITPVCINTTVEEKTNDH